MKNKNHLKIIGLIILIIALFFLIISIIDSFKPDKTDNISNNEVMEEGDIINNNIMYLSINDTKLVAELEDNSSVDYLISKLEENDITINMNDYANMEKVGSFGFNLPKNDEQINTEAGDLILYQGSYFVIYYEPNSWAFTKLGKIKDITNEKLKKILGNGDVTVTLSLNEKEK